MIAVRIICAALAVIALAMAACDSGGEERIEAQNSAAAGGDETPVAAAPTPDEDGEKRSVFDLREGDCVTDEVGGDDGELEETGSVTVVACSNARASGRVWLLHAMSEGADAAYPGDAEVEATADEVCARPGGLFTYLIPLEESWEAGDRTITCIEVLGFDYAIGGCIGRPETGHRVTDCAADGAFGEITALVDVTSEYGLDSGYPGEPYFDDVFARECEETSDYFLFPTEDTWARSDRLVVCISTFF